MSYISNTASTLLADDMDDADGGEGLVVGEEELKDDLAYEDEEEEDL